MIEQFDRSQFPAITELGDALRANPIAWRDVPEGYRKALEHDLMPYSVNDPAKRGWIRQWWLRCEQSDVDAINAALPPHIRVAGRALVGGGLALSCDLLSDSKPGQTYEKAREAIEGLPLIYLPSFIEPPAPSFTP